jgi:hypothetical protein
VIDTDCTHRKTALPFFARQFCRTLCRNVESFRRQELARRPQFLQIVLHPMQTAATFSEYGLSQSPLSLPLQIEIYRPLAFITPFSNGQRTPRPLPSTK